MLMLLPNICFEVCKDMPSGAKYGQLSGWNFSNIRVCRKSGKEAERNSNWLQGGDSGGKLENPILC